MSEEKVCPKCFTKSKATAKFCRKCGYKLSQIPQQNAHNQPKTRSIAVPISSAASASPLSIQDNAESVFNKEVNDLLGYIKEYSRKNHYNRTDLKRLDKEKADILLKIKNIRQNYPETPVLPKAKDALQTAIGLELRILENLTNMTTDAELLQMQNKWQAQLNSRKSHFVAVRDSSVLSNKLSALAEQLKQLITSLSELPDNSVNLHTAFTWSSTTTKQKDTIFANVQEIQAILTTSIRDFPIPGNYLAALANLHNLLLDKSTALDKFVDIAATILEKTPAVARELQSFTINLQSKKTDYEKEFRNTRGNYIYAMRGLLKKYSDEELRKQSSLHRSTATTTDAAQFSHPTEHKYSSGSKYSKAQISTVKRKYPPTRAISAAELSHVTPSDAEKSSATISVSTSKLPVPELPQKESPADLHELKDLPSTELQPLKPLRDSPLQELKPLESFPSEDSKQVTASLDVAEIVQQASYGVKIIKNDSTNVEFRIMLGSLKNTSVDILSDGYCVHATKHNFWGYFESISLKSETEYDYSIRDYYSHITVECVPTELLETVKRKRSLGEKFLRIPGSKYAKIMGSSDKTAKIDITVPTLSVDIMKVIFDFLREVDFAVNAL